MTALIVLDFKLDYKWYALYKNYHDNEEELKALELRIYHTEMLMVTLIFVNTLIVVIFLIRNYQNIIDRWRKIRGIKSKPLLAVEASKD